MRGSKSIASGIILGAVVCGAAVAPATEVRTTINDCQQVGSDVSALIDAKTGSPNLASARAAFQVGIMECVEGNDTSANKYYQDAKRLLGEPVALRPAPAKPVVPAEMTVNRDCHDVGSEVSALIDAKTGSPNLPAARAAFQIGVMQCMEGDDVSASKRYDEAKKLLSNN